MECGCNRGRERERGRDRSILNFRSRFDSMRSYGKFNSVMLFGLLFYLDRCHSNFILCFILLLVYLIINFLDSYFLE